MKDPILKHINENREGFDNDQPDALVWEHIQQELHPKKKRKIPFWFKMAAVFAGIFGTVWYISSTRITESENVAQDLPGSPASYDFSHDLDPNYKDPQENQYSTNHRNVIRGGSWKDIGYYLQTGTRTYEYQDNANSYVGFRNVNTEIGRANVDGGTFSWNFGDGNVGFLNGSALNYSSVATYDVIVEDANGCVGSQLTAVGAKNATSQLKMNPDGTHTGKTYNENKDLLMSGDFKDGKLWNGEMNIYDDFGTLTRTEVYKNGVFDGYSYLSPYENPGYYYESYEEFVENPFVKPLDEALSTFSIDVDAAGYSNMRRFINDGYIPPKDAVKLEEMINYFNYDLPEPKGEHPFSISTEVGVCPWNKRNQLLQVCIKGKTIQQENLPPSNLVFLLDVSGSMEDANKLPLLKKGFKMLVNELRPEDKVSIVVYAGAAGVVLEPTSGSKKEVILDALDNLSAGGSTAGGEGILMAYKLAEKNFLKEGNNRIILATDGDFNVGLSDDNALVELIEEKRKSGVFLSVLGFGEGNLQSNKMEKIADNGNGNYAYIDNILEAKKVLVTEMGGTLFTIAKDVKLQLEFNPLAVSGYRLLGYENRMLATEDFEDDLKDAGELGSGHTVIALYEIIPNRAKTLGNEKDLKYQTTTVDTEGRLSKEMVTISFRYKEPKGTKSKLISTVVFNENATTPSTNFTFASAVAEFGLLLRDSEYKGHATFEQVVQQAKLGKGSDVNGYRAEFINLVEQGSLLFEEYQQYVESLKK